MHLLRQQQQQQYQLFCLFFIFITQTVCLSIRENRPYIRCNILQKNCTLVLRNSSVSNTNNSRDDGRVKTARNYTSLRTPITPTITTSRTNSIADFDEFSENLKRAALILAGIAICLGIFRICLMLCKSRSRTNSYSNHPRSHVATIEQNQFKPDLPPAYAEAIATIENDGGKLPTYEELPSEQRRQQYVYNNNGYIATQI